MSDLIDDPTPGQNAPEFTVSDLSGAVKRTLEGEFGRVRVRGEVGRTMLARSGHLYFDLKDDRAVLASVSWKGSVARMRVRPEEGMEVVATGRITTFPGQSKYQLIVEEVAPAGVGALMAMLEKRKTHLAAEGLFDPARKSPLPYLPQVIGVVTSPQGAVIRDILHRLRDRFPRQVLVWPVAVQGDACAPQVSAAIAGFNALPLGGPIPRPDLLIVARGGGSLEDLWGFNEESVVRAAAASRIPLISAVGHETDTTLIDFASDLRAPTPTAAAEHAVPVRLDLLAAVESYGARLARAAGQGVTRRQQRLRDVSRALPRLDEVLTRPAQRLDLIASRLDRGLQLRVAHQRTRLGTWGSRLRPGLLAQMAQRRAERLRVLGAGLHRGVTAPAALARRDLTRMSTRLRPALVQSAMARQRLEVQRLSRRLAQVATADVARRRERLGGLERMRTSLGYTQTLARGYAVLRDDAGKVVTQLAPAQAARALEVEVMDGRFTVVPDADAVSPEGRGSEVDPAPHPASPKAAVAKPKRSPSGSDGQGSLF